MDCAKGVGARIAQPNKPINKMRGLLRVHRLLPLLIAVPTTAGTGSEVTLAAVITDDETHYNYPINDFVHIPRFAVHDPEFARSARLHYGADGHGRPDACRRGLYRLGRSNERRLVVRMNAALDIPKYVTGIRRSDIPEMAAHADAEANPLYLVPLLMDRLELMRMYEVVAGGMFEGEN
ncbi:iron-containing alcohol dehydrogenase [Collinsella sp. HCP28S3_E9]|uniref:iron-containing alcohol dehydrogenase n=1 Tax=unclassified Collinsella TaxID=2637548 RepID=UPI003F89539A